MKLKRIAVGIVGAIAALTMPASASPLSPHAYALWRTKTTVPIHGTYFVSQNTGEDLYNPNPDSGQIITKETWLNFSFSNGGEWIEAGTLYGRLYRSFSNHTVDYWDGIFIATNGCAGVSGSQCSAYTTTFREGEVGSQVVNGKHNFIIRKNTDGSGNYEVYIDYNATTAINGSSFTVPDPISADMGIESSDTTNSFTSGTVAYDFWVVDPSNENNSGTAGWYPVNTAIATTEVDGNYNGASVNVQYPYNNGTTVPAGVVTQSNRITFTHN